MGDLVGPMDELVEWQQVVDWGYLELYNAVLYRR